jgi:DNA-binding NarL/FixJ family response regulator
MLGKGIRNLAGMENASTSPQISVAIVEDDQEIRQTLKLIIDGTPGYACSEVFADAETAITSLPSSPPDVILMDVELPGKSGIEAVEALKPQLETSDILMLTVRDDAETVFQAICAGATGYLLKNTPPTRLLQAIDEVRQGGSPMSASVARMVLQSFHKPKQELLSERELQILTLLVDGKNYKVIAEALFVSPHTVRTHIKNIYAKLHVNSRAEAVRKAIEDKMV